ncbi:MAG: diguanylate cyclase [Synergistetes bacterium]|nr:diguanylate cyclase [Synergistota bacterium]
MRKALSLSIVVIGGIIVLITIPIILIPVLSSIRDTVYSAEERLINAILNSTIRLIDLQFENLYQEKQSRLMEIHKDLKSFTLSAVALIKKVRGKINKERAIQNLRNIKLFIYDETGKKILGGKSIFPPELIKKGIKSAKISGETFMQFRSEGHPYLLYFKHYPKMGWIAMSTYSLERLEEDFKVRYYQSIFNLRNALKGIKLEKTGYIAILSEDGKILLHPNPKLEGKKIPPEPERGRSMLNLIKEAAKKKKHVFSYLWYSPDGKSIVRKLGFVRYYRPLKWYVLATVYEEDVREKIRRMNTVVGTIVGAGALLSLLLAALLTHRLRREVSFLLLTWETAQVGIAICSGDGHTITSVNRSFSELTGKKEEELIGRSISDLIHPEDRPIFSKYIANVRRGTQEDCQIRFRKETGENIHVILKSSMCSEKRVFLHSFIDISEIIELQMQLERANEVLQKLSSRDHLTGAFNRRTLDTDLAEKLEEARVREEHISIIMLDIDHFKRINDTYGHQVGDYILKSLVRLIHSKLRSEDTIYRYGGEEFVIILPGASKKNAIKVAERLRKEIESFPFTYRKEEPPLRINITCSFGVATFPEDGATPEELLKRADKALYRAKEGGRNRVEIA